MFLHYIMRIKLYRAMACMIYIYCKIYDYMWTEMIRSKVSNCQISCFISTLSPIFDTRDFIILLVGKWTTLITALKIVKREVVRFCCLFISLFWTALLAISVLWFVPVLTWFIISCFSIYNKHLIPNTASTWSSSLWDLE